MGLTTNNIKYISCVMLIGMAVFLGVALRFSAINNTLVDNPIRADAYDYYNYSKNLVEYGVYSRQPSAEGIPKADALRSPGFPLFASLFYNQDQHVFVANVLKAQTSVQCVVFLFLTVIFIRNLGYISAFFASLMLWTFPHFISINTYFLTESLFTSFIGLIIFCSVFLYGDNGDNSRPKALFFGLFGLLLGLSAITRPIFQYFPVFLFLAVFVWKRKIPRELFITIMIAYLPMAIWGGRNLVSIGEWSDSTLMINGLYHGSFPYFMYNNNPATFGFPYRFDPMASEVYQGVGHTLRIILDRAIVEPSTYVQWYLAGKQFFLWQWDIIAGQGDIFIYPTLASPYYDEEGVAFFTHGIHKALHPFWVCVAFAGLFFLAYQVVRSKIDVNFFLFLNASVLFYAVIVHVVVAPFPRYGIPFKISLIIIFIFIIKRIVEWIQMRFASSFRVITRNKQ